MALKKRMAVTLPAGPRLADTAARLKASLKDDENQLYRDGREHGEDWAARFAEARDLRRLSHWQEGFGTDWAT